jgi:hypothetical protein
MYFKQYLLFGETVSDTEFKTIYKAIVEYMFSEETATEYHENLDKNEILNEFLSIEVKNYGCVVEKN